MAVIGPKSLLADLNCQFSTGFVYIEISIWHCQIPPKFQLCAIHEKYSDLQIP